MDFGDILDEWNKETAKPRGKPRRTANSDSTEPVAPVQKSDESLPRANPMDIWLRRYGITDKDTENEYQEEMPHERRRRLHSMKCEAQIDLHGLTRDEAWIRLEAFFADCVRQELNKVLIIHGKGTHSDEDPVLKNIVQQFIEKNPHAGESGFSNSRQGGSGSTWVILK